VYIPKLFPLPAKGGLAASQLYDPTLGAPEFVNAVLEHVTGTALCTKTKEERMWLIDVLKRLLLVYRLTELVMHVCI
jgi:hypothetical protein